MAHIGPVILSVIGDRYIQSARILAIIWEGETVAGDTAVVEDPQGNGRIWRGRANDTNTYVGGNFGEKGIHAPNGFALTQISAGSVSVYLRED